MNNLKFKMFKIFNVKLWINIANYFIKELPQIVKIVHLLQSLKKTKLQ